MTPACDSETLATSWPVAMNIAVRPFAACAPLFAEPARKAPALETWRHQNRSFALTPIMLFSRSPLIVHSATTRLPRVSSMLARECFLSVSMLPDRM